MGFINLILFDELFEDCLNQFVVESTVFVVIKSQVVINLPQYFSQCRSSLTPFLVYNIERLQLNVNEDLSFYFIYLNSIHWILLVNKVFRYKKLKGSFDKLVQVDQAFFPQLFGFKEIFCQSVFANGVVTESIAVEINIAFKGNI